MTKYSTPSEEWLRRKALEEDGCEIGAGMPDHPLRAPDTAMTDRIDEIEFRAHREDLAIKAGYSSMVGLSVSQRLSKDRAFLLSAIRALQEEKQTIRRLAIKYHGLGMKAAVEWRTGLEEIARLVAEEDTPND